MEKIYIVIKTYSDYEGGFSTNIKAFFDEDEAEIFRLDLEKENKDFRNQLSDLRNKRRLESISNEEFNEQFNVLHKLALEKDFDTSLVDHISYEVEELEIV